MKNVDLWLAALTGVAFTLCFHVLDARGPFVVAAILAWGARVAWLAARDPERLRAWGLRSEPRAWIAPVLLAIPSIAAMAAVAFALGRDVPWGHFALAVLLYPLWGVVQQLLVQGVVAGSLEDRGLPRLVVVVATAAVFGGVHLPIVPVATATFALGLAFTPMFLRHRSVWPLGLFHGVLGACLYYLVLGRDPFAELALGAL